MQCPKCGYQNPDGALYCNLCHEVFKTRSDNRPEAIEELRYRMMHKYREKRNWKQWIALDVWLSILVVIAVIIWFYHKQKEPKEDIEEERVAAITTTVPGTSSSQLPAPPANFVCKQTAHFDIYSSNEVLADNIASQIERYYEIPIDLGLTEINFWEKGKVSIYIYETAEQFRQTTKSSNWSSGYSNFISRVIYSYEGVEQLIEAVIPHELTHIIFAHFMEQSQNYPKWLSEGLATYEEAKYCHVYASNYEEILNTLRQGEYLGVDKLTRTDISKLKNLKMVQAWYVESLSLVTYLLEVYGRGNFYTLCKNLKEGVELEEALRNAYAPNFNSLSELTGKWLQYIHNNEQKW